MVKLRSRLTVSMETHLVTGGCGYPGYHLGKALSSLGHAVILYDIKEPSNPLVNGMVFIKGDIRDYDSVLEACEGVHCVYHLASYGMSGREQLNWKMTEEVNIQGTENIIKACCDQNVPRLVYASTFNVVFGGSPIENGDETLPYFPVEKHPDHYSRTKALAEMKVLNSAGLRLQNNDQQLQTCALRLAGVYGPGEQRHLPRIVDYMKRGFYRFTVGKEDSRVQFLHIDNLTQAFVKAGNALSITSQKTTEGQAYFISDGEAVNNFSFFQPLEVGLGYGCRKFRVPLNVIYFVALMIEMIHYIVGPVYSFQPLLTRAEVYKIGVTHYFSIEKARKYLDYQPTQHNMDDIIQYFRSHGHAAPNPLLSKSRLKTFLMDLTLALLFASLVISFLPLVR